jgi:hypothetical protein
MTTNAQWLTTASSSMPTSQQDRTIIFVSNTYSGRSTKEAVVFWGTNSGSAGWGYAFDATATNKNYNVYNGSTYYNVSGAIVVNTTQLISAASTGQNTTFYLNGASVGSVSTTYTTSGSALWLFNLPSEGTGFQGSCSELIVLATADLNLIQRCEGYLAWKWGLQTLLSSSHSYALMPPTVAA